MSAEEPNLIDKSSRLMPSTGARLLNAAVRLAESLGLNAFLVGGPVRDTLLGRPILNADITVEGDALPLAARLASRSGVRVVKHPRFGTAAVTAGAFVLDLVTARSETYDHPGALPSVSPGSIHDDLRRRDFTINAIALALNGPRRGEITDPLDGRDDLRRGIVRALHERSFQDDATRILRAARYEVRLEFRLEERTESWARRDVSYLSPISGARLHHEIARTFDEPEPERVLLRLTELGALPAIHPSLAFTPEQSRGFENLRRIAGRSARPAFWPLLAWNSRPGDVAAVAERLALRSPQRNAVAVAAALRGLEPDLAADSLRNSRLAATLEPFPPAALWAFTAITASDTARRRTLRYLKRLRRIKASLNGDDLIAIGATPGPALGDLLRRLRDARLDGLARSRDDELHLARQILGGPPP